MPGIIIPAMVFLHIIADFNLQGILAQLKQKQWWKDNHPDELYKRDWLTSLALHSFMWAFLVHVPIIIVAFIIRDEIVLQWIIVSIVGHTVMHAIIDHCKANKHALSLTSDQLLHFLQIMAVWFSFMAIK